MRQQTFSDVEYSHRRKGSRREEFLSVMDSILPWEKWTELVRPYYPAGKRGRPPKSIETMLRMDLLEEWYGLSAAGIEDVIYDSYAMRKFMHLDFLTEQEQVPGATTLLRFRRLLKKTGIRDEISRDVEDCLKKEGLALRRGSIADAALIPAAGKK